MTTDDISSSPGSTEDHVIYKRLEACVENRLTPEERARVEAHLQVCFQCKREAEEIALFRRNIKPPHVRIFTLARLLAFGFAAIAVLLVWGTIRVLTHVPELSPEYAEYVRRVLAQGRLDVPVDVLSLSGPAPDSHAPIRSGLRLKGPIRTAVLSTRPEFSWEPLPQKARYLVSIFDQNLDRIDHSAPLTGNSWRPNVVLNEGAIYTWDVRVQTVGSTFVVPLPEERKARFRVLTHRESDILQQAAYQAHGDHLVLGIFDARHGVLDDAETELSQAGPKAAPLLAYLRKVRAR